MDTELGATSSVITATPRIGIAGIVGRHVGSWISVLASVAGNATGWLIGLSLGVVMSGLRVEFGGVAGSEAVGWAAVAGWGCVAVALGLALPRTLARWLVSWARRRTDRGAESNPSAYAEDESNAPSWNPARPANRIDGDAPTRLWLTLAGVSIAAGLSVAVLPLFMATADQLHRWFTEHFLWTPRAQSFLQFVLFIITSAGAFLCMGAASAVYLRLGDLSGRRSASAMAALLLGIAAGILVWATVSWIAATRNPGSPGLAVASLPLFLVTVLAVHRSKAPGRAMVNERANDGRSGLDTGVADAMGRSWTLLVLPACATAAGAVWWRLYVVSSGAESLHAGGTASALIASVGAGLWWARRDPKSSPVRRPVAFLMPGWLLALAAVSAFLAFQGVTGGGWGSISGSRALAVAWLVLGTPMFATQFVLGLGIGRRLRVIDEHSARWSADVLPAVMMTVLAAGVSLAVVVPWLLNRLAIR